MRVVITGAGPAGTSCAIALLKAGFDVVIIEQKAFPRFKPGESCHPGIEPLLSQLGVLGEVLKHNPVRFRSINLKDEKGERQEYFNAERTWEGFQLPRDMLDQILLNKAVSDGADLRCPVKAIGFMKKDVSLNALNTDHGVINFDFFIDATGSRSGFSKRTGATYTKYSRPIITHYAQIYSKADQGNWFSAFFECINDYWGYIALIKPYTYSVTFSSLNNSDTGIEQFIIAHFSDSFEVINKKAFDTSWRLVDRRPFVNLYNVGDSLMMYDPTSSKGTLKALITGIYCAHVIDLVFKHLVTREEAIILFRDKIEKLFFHELKRISTLLPKKIVNTIFNVTK